MLSWPYAPITKLSYLILMHFSLSCGFPLDTNLLTNQFIQIIINLQYSHTFIPLSLPRPWHNPPCPQPLIKSPYLNSSPSTPPPIILSSSRTKYLFTSWEDMTAFDKDIMIIKQLANQCTDSPEKARRWMNAIHELGTTGLELWRSNGSH